MGGGTPWLEIHVYVVVAVRNSVSNFIQRRLKSVIESNCWGAMAPLFQKFSAYSLRLSSYRIVVSSCNKFTFSPFLIPYIFSSHPFPSLMDKLYVEYKQDLCAMSLRLPLVVRCGEFFNFIFCHWGISAT